MFIFVLMSHVQPSMNLLPGQAIEHIFKERWKAKEEKLKPKFKRKSRR